MIEEIMTPCGCDHLSKLLNDPDLGITLLEDGIFTYCDGWVLYYCPICGGRMVNFWNACISDEERERLQKSIDGITTFEEAIKQLGPPDYDSPIHMYESIEGHLIYNEKESKKRRNIEYYHLSECANLEFYFSTDGTHECRIILKHLSSLEEQLS